MPGDYLDGHFIRERYVNHNKGVDNFLAATDQYINSHSYTELIVIQYDGMEEREYEI